MNGKPAPPLFADLGGGLMSESGLDGDVYYRILHLPDGRSIRQHWEWSRIEPLWNVEMRRVQCYDGRTMYMNDAPVATDIERGKAIELVALLLHSPQYVGVDLKPQPIGSKWTSQPGLVVAAPAT